MWHRPGDVVGVRVVGGLSVEERGVEDDGEVVRARDESMTEVDGDTTKHVGGGVEEVTVEVDGRCGVEAMEDAFDGGVGEEGRGDGEGTRVGPVGFLEDPCEVTFSVAIVRVGNEV